MMRDLLFGSRSMRWNGAAESWQATAAREVRRFTCCLSSFQTRSLMRMSSTQRRHRRQHVVDAVLIDMRHTAHRRFYV